MSTSSSSHPSAGIGRGATLVLPRRHRPTLAISLLVALAVGVLTVLAIGRLRRPNVDPGTSGVPVAATSSATAAPVAATASVSVAPPSDDPSSAPAAPPGEAATLPAPTAPGKAAGNTYATPVVFGARALVREGDRLRERKSRVTLVDGKITVRANDDNRDVLYAVP